MLSLLYVLLFLYG